MARCFDELAARGGRGIVSFADPVPRHTATGAVICPGHVGTIYQATNAIYTGRGAARTIIVLPDGTTLNDRASRRSVAKNAATSTSSSGCAPSVPHPPPLILLDHGQPVLPGQA